LYSSAKLARVIKFAEDEMSEIYDTRMRNAYVSRKLEGMRLLEKSTRWRRGKFKN
jgi:hypothetical protein